VLPLVPDKMLTISTNCNKAQQVDIELQFDPESALDIDVKAFVRNLEGQILRGTEYKIGQLIQIGWAMVKIEMGNGSKLALWEPDFMEMPARFVPGVTNTFRHLRLQKSVLESLGLEDRMLFPSMLENGIKCSRHEDSVDFVMDRAEPTKTDSGWFFGCDDNTHDHNNPVNLHRASLYELAHAKADCIPFLALPPGTLLLKRGKSLEVFLSKQRLPIKKDSYLDRKLRTSEIAR